jgi:histidinol dehydrogenase
MRVLSGAAAARRIRQLEARTADFEKVQSTVSAVVSDVRRGGDRVLRKYAEQWDGLVPRQPFAVTAPELEAAWVMSSREFRRSVQQAASNIRRFCDWQRPQSWTRRSQGLTSGQVVRPLQSVGCYVPGGRHPLVSTLLMTVIPAQVAGVAQIKVASPSPAGEVLAAAYFLGVREVYRIGGAQAIAALAYGTKSIPRVEKIVGPGNLYVTVAKKMVSFDCAIDFLAGPTEVVIVSDRGRADFIAADLTAQAEHDTDALPIFITTSLTLARKVSHHLDRVRDAVAAESLRRNGSILLAGNRQEAFTWANRIAPEHITIDKNDLALIQNAGSIFVGDYSAQAAGDYASGPNHVLPTSGVARFRGGLSVNDFVKVITVQELSKKGLSRMGSTITTLAEIEGLAAHAQSIRVRCPNA